MNVSLPIQAAALLLMPVLALAAEPTPPAKAATSPSYEQQIAEWHSQRVERLTRDGGWLTLIGLFWLEPGENSMGSAPESRVILPADRSPAQLATLDLEGGNVTLRPAGSEGMHLLRVNDMPVTGPVALKSDAAEEATMVRMSSVSFFIIKRDDKIGVRVRDSQAPALAHFKDIPMFPIRPDWRIEARFEPYQPPKQIPITNVLGMTDPNPSPGAVVFERDGVSYRIDALVDTDDGRLFLIFTDQTTGKETYGAGRFLYTEGAPKDGKVTVDFNKAYNPPCAFSAYATCPLPPRQNRLAVKIEAGEKTFGHH